MSAILIRRAMASDSAQIAQIHFQAWCETYHALLPPQIFAQDVKRDRGALWEQVLASDSESNVGAVFIAQNGADVCGFLSVCKQRDADLLKQGFMGEFTALYVLEVHQRLGVGRALMKKGAQYLIGKDINSAALWVLQGNNKAYRFYKALDGKFLTAQADETGGFSVVDIALGWKTIDCLL